MSYYTFSGNTYYTNVFYPTYHYGYVHPPPPYYVYGIAVQIQNLKPGEIAKCEEVYPRAYGDIVGQVLINFINSPTAWIYQIPVMAPHYKDVTLWALNKVYPLRSEDVIYKQS
jgi:hypothetical protein